jgi:uncharacterized membrane protein
MRIRTLRLVVWCYTAAIILAICFAWFEDIMWRNDSGEHMLPDVMLSIVTVPLSLGLVFLGALLKWPFAQLAYLSLCGALQVAGLWYDYGKNRSAK